MCHLTVTYTRRLIQLALTLRALSILVTASSGWRTGHSVSFGSSRIQSPRRTSDTTVPSVRVSFLDTTLYPNQRGTMRHSAHHTTPRNIIAMPTTQYLWKKSQ